MQNNIKYLISDNAIVYTRTSELRIVATGIKLSTTWYRLLLKRTVEWHESANIIYVQAECHDKLTKCMFKWNLNAILILHGSFPLSISFSLGVVLLQRNLSLSISLLLRSSAPVAAHPLHHLISLFLLPLFPFRDSFPSRSCHLFFTSLSRVAKSFSMEPWIMFMERNDKECYLRPITIARVETGVYLSDYYLVTESERSFTWLVSLHLRFNRSTGVIDSHLPVVFISNFGSLITVLTCSINDLSLNAQIYSHLYPNLYPPYSYAKLCDNHVPIFISRDNTIDKALFRRDHTFISRDIIPKKLINYYISRVSCHSIFVSYFSCDRIREEIYTRAQHTGINSRCQARATLAK